MIQILRRNLDIVDIECPLHQVVISDGRAEFISRDREVRVLHLPRERLPQRLVQSLRPVNIPFVSRHIERCEERYALNVIPMRMTDQNMTGQTLAAC